MKQETTMRLNTLVRNLIAHRCVDEPFTSQRCHSCRGQLQVVFTRLKQKKRKPKRLREPAAPDVHLSGNRRRDVVGVRRCQTCRGPCGEPKHWHRDANAARNILEAGLASLRGECRPAYLTILWGRREGNRERFALGAEGASTRLASTHCIAQRGGVDHGRDFSQMEFSDCL